MRSITQRSEHTPKKRVAFVLKHPSSRLITGEMKTSLRGNSSAGQGSRRAAKALLGKHSCANSFAKCERWNQRCRQPQTYVSVRYVPVTGKTASMPVQCAPSRFATLNSFSLSPVQFSCSSLAANKCRPPTTPYWLVGKSLLCESQNIDDAGVATAGQHDQSLAMC